MKIVLWLPILLCCFACNGNAQPANLSVSEFEQQLNTGKAQLLDVRTAGEYQSGHLKNALQADWLNKSQFAERVKYLDPAKPILVYCASGVRSAQAASWLLEHGFSVVSNMKGGTAAWKLAGKPMDAPASVAQMPVGRFQQSVQQSGTVLVDVGAEWCPPCKQMEPVVSSLQNTLKGKFTLLKVDGGNDIDVMKAINAAVLPTFIVYKNGKEVWRKEGIVSKEVLMEQLQ